MLEEDCLRGYVMKIVSVYGCPYEDHEGDVLILQVRLEEGERIRVGEAILIEMMDDSFIEREIMVIDPKRAGDFAPVSNEAKKWIQSGKTKRMSVGPCSCEVVVKDVEYHEVKTEEEVQARALLEEMNKKVCLSPYKEILGGDKSIFDYVDPQCTVPGKVIAYLRTTQPYLMSPGIYEHPFRKGMKLSGPYLYTDGHYYWDRDLWKYVLKYHVKLPKEFIDYVMSDEGTAFLEEQDIRDESWQKSIRSVKESEKTLCLLPDNAGDIALEDF